MSQLPLIYVAHPFGGKQHLLDRAEEWTATLNLHFDALFVAPWIPQCRHWENYGKTLERGVLLNEQAIRRSDAIILVGGEFTSGMMKEIRVSIDANIRRLVFVAFVTPGELISTPDAVSHLRKEIAELRP